MQDVRGFFDDLTLPEFLGWVLLGNSLLNWLVFAITLVVVIGTLVLLKRLLLRRLTALAARTSNPADDVAVELLRRTRALIILFIALSIALRTLALSERAAVYASKIGYAALFLQFGLWGSATITYFINRYATARQMDEADTAMTIRAAGFLGRLILWSVILLLLLQNVFDIDVTALITGLGIGGVAIALAVQNILGDLFGAISIVLDKPFVVGDFIIVDTVMGTVEYVGLKTTRLRSISGEQIIISNGDLLSSRIRNFKRMYERRIVFTIGVEYGTPADTLAAIGGWIRDIVEAQPEARFDRSHFFAFADSSLNFETVYYVKKPDYAVYMDTQQAINLAIVRKFEAEGIEFAFPTRTIHIGGGADGLAAAVAPARS